MVCRPSARSSFLRRTLKTPLVPRDGYFASRTTYRPLRCKFISFLLAGGTSRTFSKFSFESKGDLCQDRQSVCLPQCPTRRPFSIANPRALLPGCPVSQL